MREDSKKVSGVRFIQCVNDEAVGREAAELVEQTLRQKPNAAIVFPTGNTPLRMYQALRRTPYSLWAQSRLFHLDEYVPPKDYQGPTSYEAYEEYMRRELFDCVGGQKYYVKHYLDRLDEYDRLIRQSGGPDLVILGIGGNGHVAFNEPGSSKDAQTRLIDLEDRTIRDNFGSTGKRGFPTQAATLGLDTVLRAKHIILLATGEKKRAIVERAFNPNTPPSADCPASWLKTHPNVTVVTDFKAGVQ
jgi:glucosamine-6-phosphate deaminase